MIIKEVKQNYHLKKNYHSQQIEQKFLMYLNTLYIFSHFEEKETSDKIDYFVDPIVYTKFQNFLSSFLILHNFSHISVFTKQPSPPQKKRSTSFFHVSQRRFKFWMSYTPKEALLSLELNIHLPLLYVLHNWSYYNKHKKNNKTRSRSTNMLKKRIT